MIQQIFTDIIGLLSLKEKTITQISKNKEAWKVGLIIILISGLISEVTSSLVESPFEQLGITLPYTEVTTASIFFAGLFFILLASFGIAIMNWIAKLFGGKGSYKQLFGPMSYSYSLSWLNIFYFIPFLGGIINFAATIWALVVSFYIIRNVHKLENAKAVWVILIPFLFGVLLFTAVTAVILLTFGNFDQFI